MSKHPDVILTLKRIRTDEEVVGTSHKFILMSESKAVKLTVDGAEIANGLGISEVNESFRIIFKPIEQATLAVKK